MTDVKKKKIYLLRDRNGGDVKAQLKENGELKVEMTFPSKILDERMLYETFVELRWELKHEEFVPDIDQNQETIFVPPEVTFH